MPNCKFCEKDILTNGALATHEPFCKNNPGRVSRGRHPNAGRKPGSIPWNKGLRGDPRCQHSEEYKQNRIGKGTGRGSTPEREAERVRKITERAKLNNGGYRPGSGRGKKGWYRGFFCDSTYELAYVVYCLDHNINIQRNTEKRQYIWNGVTKNYIPDFIVDEKLVEIKGYKSEQWEAKLSANPDVIVLYQADLKPVFDYVINKHGKDFVKLYETESLAESA